MKLVMRVHFGRDYANANWDGKRMTFGDGDSQYYPFVSMDVAAHEIGHGFTWQRSSIDISYLQMAALHELFGDMVAAAEN